MPTPAAAPHPATPQPGVHKPPPIPDLIAARMPRARAWAGSSSAAGEAAPLGRWNGVFGWWSIVLSLCAGAVLGLWAFGGPFTPPTWFGAYDDPGRRLLRLAHIAAVMLPVLSFHFVRALPRCGFSRTAAERWCAVLLIGAIGLPAALAVAGFWRDGLYLLPLPVTAVLLPIGALAVRLTVVELRGVASSAAAPVEP